jgi:hypothetical protein
MHENSKGNWVKLHRELLDNKMFRRNHNAVIVFVALLLLVRRQDGKYDTGRIKLASLLNMHPSTVYKALKVLQREHVIDMKCNNKYTEISICNWSKYQHTGNSKVTAKEQQSNTKQEVRSKNSNNINIIPDKNDGLVNEMMVAFEKSLGFKLKQRPSHERACRSIIARLGYNKAMDAVNASIACQNEKYAPRIANPVALDKKLDDLMVYYRQKNNKQKSGTVE